MPKSRNRPRPTSRQRKAARRAWTQAFRRLTRGLTMQMQSAQAHLRVRRRSIFPEIRSGYRPRHALESIRWLQDRELAMARRLEASLAPPPGGEWKPEGTPPDW